MSTERNGRILIVGAGVAGLSSARALAAEGLRVVLIDRDEPGGEATWAAGGMLSPLGEADGPGAFHDLAWASFQRYPEFVARLEAESGRAVGYLRSGKLLVAGDERELERLRGRTEWLAEGGHAVRLLGPEVLEEEPSLSRKVAGALLVEEDHQVDPRRLVRALLADCDRLGVERVRGEVDRLLEEGGEVRAVELADGSGIEGDAVVLAAGAWSGEIRGLPRPLPVRPVRGQMASVRGPEGYLDRVLARGSLYLIPRDDGTIVIGATEEEAGYQSVPTAEGVRKLLSGAIDLVPALAGFPLLDHWAGLRPGTPDGLPFLGLDPEVGGLVYATGHYRNGILLAPITAEWVVAAVTGGAPPLSPAPFRPDRFPFPSPDPLGID